MEGIPQEIIPLKGIPQQVIEFPTAEYPIGAIALAGWEHFHWVRRWESHVVIREMRSIGTMQIYSIDVYLDSKPGASETLHRVSEDDQ